ncbi:hypothetical protein GCM10027275_37220 [Rhabdobacter roseus]|uniref:Uncharacterized protein YecT (DUF1311 family) n=1 Tax=Rhabdobacter roseus TaxID=1655419 RepID=A0A840U171_9BACT|nr:lysozyme inhibitor LprI family protein [Rhabdobacter roseus]MBB5285870.1 uncharacterized protein YecT (DUF1311 family) [Rhabdobacter roseus]
MAPAARAQPKPYPIDLAVSDCLEVNSSTAGMVQCLQKGYEKWDEELNKQYKKLFSRLNKEQKAALQATQREWMKFRDLELAYLTELYATQEGTLYRISLASEQLELIKKRALVLEKHNELLDMK